MGIEPKFGVDDGEADRRLNASALIIYPVWEPYSAALPSSGRYAVDGHRDFPIWSWLSLIVAFAICAAGDAHGPIAMGAIAGACVMALLAMTALRGPAHFNSLFRHSLKIFGATRSGFSAPRLASTAPGNIRAIVSV